MPSQLHERLIASAIVRLRLEGATQISATAPGYQSPSQIGNYIPDVTAVYNGIPIILEAETEDGLQLPHTKSQLLTFRKLANLRGSYLILVVATKNREEANRLNLLTFGNVLDWTF